ncbi:uncharacterized protein H6S33_002847 [Morchella sextelata]|uniref:uncharacterized protein n=1 Tax=Morchella sextelata TaxID=1174677 RepID=UPI001D051F7F|nr:uncharacterized protein H6S33_002847 [Morchella sextelata]KAH0607813.1 hypothetical protein H6S33_002847 [Morchella sextelata]
MAIEYPYTFALLVPLDAWRRRHWAVVLSSSVLLITNLVVVPLISGIFEEKVLEESLQGTAVRYGITNNTDTTLSTKFTYSAFDAAWMSGSLPPFTTNEYALAPIGQTRGRGKWGKELWIVNTELFEATLECEAAGRVRIGYTGDRNVGVNITSADGKEVVRFCDLDSWFDGRLKDYEMAYCNEYTEFITPWTSIAYQLRLGRYMFAWARGGGLPKGLSTSNSTRYTLPQEINAVFCNTKYWRQDVIANITMPSGNIDIESVERKGERKEIPMFGSFERSLNGTVDAPSSARFREPVKADLVGFGYKPVQPPDVDNQLKQRFGSRPEGWDTFYVRSNGSSSSVYMKNKYSLSGFSLYSEKNNKTLDKMLDKETLIETYEGALKMLFSVAVSTELVLQNDTVSIPVTRKVATRGFGVNKAWAQGTLAGLALTMVLVAIMVVVLRRRPCNLDGEPNSIAAALRLLYHSPELCRKMENSEFHSPRKVQEVLDGGDERYKLELVPGEGPRIRVFGGGDGRSSKKSLPPPEETYFPPAYNQKPWALRMVPGVSFLTCFILVTLILIATFSYARTHDGIPMPGSINSFAYKFLFSYLPLAVGMAIEPVLVTLGASHAMIAPYRALTRGRAYASRSVTIDYDKSPPHFQLIRSLRSGNYILASLTLSILLSNVLAVALVGLYYASAASVVTPYSLKVIGDFNATGNEMYYLFDKNLGGSLPQTWTTNEYYVVLPPFARGANGMQEEYPTQAIGVSVSCSHVSADRISYSCVPSGLNMSYEAPTCSTMDLGDWNHVYIHDPCGASTTDYLRYAWNNPTGDSIVRTTNCSDYFFPIWVERPMDPEPQNRTVPWVNDFKSVVMNCSAVEEVKNVTVTVKDGQILKLNPVNDYDQDQIKELYARGTQGLSKSFTTIIEAAINNTRTNNYIAWFSYLMLSISPDLASPTLSHLPNSTLAPAAFSKVYSRLFAINLRLYDSTLISTSGTRDKGLVDRVYVSTHWFVVSIIILAWAVVTMTLLYGKERGVKGQMPSKLVGVWAHLYRSNAKEECANVQGANPSERGRELRKRGNRYGYGPFEGGRHVGVYRDEGLEVGGGIEMDRWRSWTSTLDER